MNQLHEKKILVQRLKKLYKRILTTQVYSIAKMINPQYFINESTIKCLEKIKQQYLQKSQRIAFEKIKFLHYSCRYFKAKEQFQQYWEQRMIRMEQISRIRYFKIFFDRVKLNLEKILKKKQLGTRTNKVVQIIQKRLHFTDFILRLETFCDENQRKKYKLMKFIFIKKRRQQQIIKNSFFQILKISFSRQFNKMRQSKKEKLNELSKISSSIHASISKEKSLIKNLKLEIVEITYVIKSSKTDFRKTAQKKRKQLKEEIEQQKQIIMIILQQKQFFQGIFKKQSVLSNYYKNITIESVSLNPCKKISIVFKKLKQKNCCEMTYSQIAEYLLLPIDYDSFEQKISTFPQISVHKSIKLLAKIKYFSKIQQVQQVKEFQSLKYENQCIKKLVNCLVINDLNYSI